MLYFHHIQKTAGTSVSANLKNFFDSDKQIEDKFIEHHHRDEAKYYDIPKFIFLTKDFTVEKKAKALKQRIDFICGHLHPSRFFPNFLSDTEINVFTFLRDPYDLRVSILRQNAMASEADIIHAAKGGVATNKINKENYESWKIFKSANPKNFLQLMEEMMSLDQESFLKRRFRSFDNPITQQLSVRFDDNKKLIKLDHDDWDKKLSLAHETLESYFYVGLVEHFDESMIRLSEILGIPYTSSQKLNVRKNRIFTEPYTKKIDKYNEKDYEIYNRYLKKFMKKKTISLGNCTINPPEIIRNGPIDFSKSIYSEGFHQRDQAGRNPANLMQFRLYSGPGKESSIKYNVVDGMYHIKLKIKFFKTSINNSLKVQINNKKLSRVKCDHFFKNLKTILKPTIFLEFEGTILCKKELVINFFCSNVYEEDSWEKRIIGFELINLEISKIK